MSAQSLNNDFFRTNMRIIKWSGVWIPDESAHPVVKFWYLIFDTLIMIYFCVLFTPGEFVVLPETVKSFPDLMKNLNMGMTHFLAIIKIYTWFSKRKEILGIIDTLSKNTVAEKIGEFDPDKIIREDRKTKQIATLAFFSVACCVGSSSCLNSLYIVLFNSENQFATEIDAFNRTTVYYNQKLPYYSWIPWDHRASRFNFACAAVFQSMAVVNSAFIIVGFDTLFTAIIGYTSCQIKILQGAFRTIRPRILRKLELPDLPTLKNSPEVEAEMMKEMNICIIMLFISRMCEKLETIFTYITLGQVLISLVVFCTCLYLTSSIPMNDGKFLVELIYLLAIEIQIYIYCYFGNKVTLRGEDISMSLYEGDWLQSSAPFKSSMMITMARMRRPIHLTIGKFTPLTISTFVTIGRASYSFFAVLKNQNQNP
ncbi:PREDICTED: odorant receptor 2a-like [Nicrophorus vespilloides]|uniref:Odorant receptor n=1 Tax=Nicrophorus vespilloides TaxID=110193 RepID=A0ABM1NAP1_NICVS|nr:PREDICTED: odorant receptor 2a-like [Nicrophorus vespilloides]